jgi:hypothetical protein
MQHKERSYSAPEGQLFANPVIGKPYLQQEIQKRRIRKAGICGQNWQRYRLAHVSAQLPVLVG